MSAEQERVSAAVNSLADELQRAVAEKERVSAEQERVGSAVNALA